VSERTGSL